jgi:hypothetical protein
VDAGVIGGEERGGFGLDEVAEAALVGDEVVGVAVLVERRVVVLALVSMCRKMRE